MYNIPTYFAVQYVRYKFFSRHIEKKWYNKTSAFICYISIIPNNLTIVNIFSIIKSLGMVKYKR